MKFRANRKWESLKKYGTTECVVPGCGKEDTLEHAKECYGYTTQFKEEFSPLEWVEYLSKLDLERFAKYKTSITKH